jgi:hypothetical protein
MGIKERDIGGEDGEKGMEFFSEMVGERLI